MVLKLNEARKCELCEENTKRIASELVEKRIKEVIEVLDKKSMPQATTNRTYQSKNQPFSKISRNVPDHLSLLPSTSHISPRKKVNKNTNMVQSTS